MFLVHHSSVHSVTIAIKFILFDINHLRLTYYSRSQWPRGPRRGTTAVPFLGLRVRIPFMAYCCILRGTGGERILDVVPRGTDLGTQVNL